MSTNDNRSVSELFSDALNQFSALLRNELQLARKEMSLKASEATMAVALLVGAGLFLIAVARGIGGMDAGAWYWSLARSRYRRRGRTSDRRAVGWHRHEPP